MQKKLKKLLKNKPAVATICAILLIIFAGGVYKLVHHSTDDSQNSIQPDIQTVQSLSPADVGLDIQPHIGNKCTTTPTPFNEVRFVLNKTDGIKHVAWQVTYDADIPQTEDIQNTNGQVTQEIESDANVNSGQAFTSHYEFLGTCSHNVCRCDTGVKSVRYTLNITKSDGKHYKVEADKSFKDSSQ